MTKYVKRTGGALSRSFAALRIAISQTAYMMSPASMKFKIHQIYFRPDQASKLDPKFIPYDNSACPMPDLREFYVFQKEFRSGRIATDAYTGYLSWKFAKKSGIDGAKFIEFCESNPGHDVYFINPFPMAIQHGNVWTHGEIHHPGILERAGYIFNQVGYSTDLKTLPTSLRTTAYCNFWVGNRRFWDEYMAFCLPIYDYILGAMPSPEREKLFARADDVIGASYFSFIFERLFTTFLLAHPEIKACGYIFSQQELKLRYSAVESEIILRAQELAEPLLSDVALMSDIAEYKKNRASHRSVPAVAFSLLQRLWRSVPGRSRLLKIGPLEKLADFAMLYLRGRMDRRRGR
jgi:hypothetical protein